MDRQPYRSRAERSPKENARRDVPVAKVDALALVVLGLLLACAVGRAWLSLSHHAIDDDLVIAVAIAGGAGWGLVRACSRRNRGS